MLILAATLALILQPDRAGNSMEPLPLRGPAPWEPNQGSGLHCSAEPRWCATTRYDDRTGWSLSIRNGNDSRHEEIPLSSLNDQGLSYAVWPHLVRNADGSILVGVLRNQGGGFAGGGWRTVHLVLIQVATTGTRAVLELPLETSASIRACFDERDRRRRRDACTDDYSFTTSVALGASDAAHLPVLRVSTVASTYPGRRARTEDSRQGRPLRRQDLTHWRDPACSYVRSFRFDAAERRYVPDSPLPACPDYLDLG